MNNKGLTIALAVSLTLNVFVLGAMAGALGTRARMEPRRPPPAGAPLMRVGEQLPPDVRQAFRERLRAEGQAAQPLLQQSRAARMEAARAFNEPTFDRAAAIAALARSREAETAAREKLDTAIVDFAAGLPVDQRSQLGQALRQPPRGGPGGRGGRVGRGGPGMGGPGMDRGRPFDGGPPQGPPNQP
jgi:uncharacterized membrane protein